MRSGVFTINLIALTAMAWRAQASETTSLVVSRSDRARDCPDAVALAARTESAGARHPYVAATDPNGARIEVSFDGEDDARSAVILAAGGKRRTFTDKASTCDGLAEAVVLALVLTADADDEWPPAAPSDASPRPSPAPERPGIGARIDAGATSAFGTVRDAAFGAQLGLHVGPRDGWWSLGAMGTWLPSSTLALSDGSAEVAYLGAGLEACLSRPLGRIVDVEACARAEAGSLSGRARGFATNEDHARPLFAGGAFVRGIFGIASPLAIFVEGGVKAPIHRENFAVEGAGTVYDPPAVGGSVAAGVALSIR